MKAILKAKAEKGFVIGEVPKPVPKAGEVLIRVRRGAICGTDLHIHEWDAWAQHRIKPPLVIGHEFAGEVAELGPGVHGFKPGDVVSAEGHIVCGICELCRTGRAHICRETKIIGVDIAGAFAEYISMPATNVWRIDYDIPIEVAAIHDPLGNAFHTALVSPVDGRSVLVEGCGPIGLMAIQVAKASGAERIFAVDVNDRRLELARRFGASEALHAARDPVERIILEQTRGAGPIVVMEMSGNPAAIRQGFNLVANGGDVRLLGIPSAEVPLNLSETIIFKGITVHGIIGRKMYSTWEQMRAYLKSGRIDPAPIITHKLPYAEIAKAMELIRQGDAGKIVLDFEG